jgi:hypothetical protein
MSHFLRKKKGGCDEQMENDPRDDDLHSNRGRCGGANDLSGNPDSRDA